MKVPHDKMLLTKKQMRFLQSLCCPGIYALVHQNRKKVYLNQSQNVLESILRLFKNFEAPNNKKINKDRNKLALVLLEKHDSPVYRRVKLKRFYDDYRNAGYKVYNNPLFVEYKIKLKVNTNYKVEIRLVNRRNDFIIIETFDTLNQGKKFLLEHENKLDDVIDKYILGLSPSTDLVISNDADVESNERSE